MSDVNTTLTLDEVAELYRRPLLDLVFEAARIHRANHDPRVVQCSTLLSIKTGACQEDCSYCSQSAHNNTDIEREKLLELDTVVDAATEAKRGGADRFCMGAAWRQVKDNAEFERVLEMVRQVKALDLETCATLGMVTKEQAEKLRDAGLDYYNHNLDTSKENYPNVITTRTFQDRLDTLESVQNADINVCSGGILGLGEEQTDRASMLRSLANLDKHPDSVPLNLLVPIPGTPFEKVAPPTESEFVRTIAVARIMMPKSVVRLSAGRTDMGEAMQALCFFAGANSIFYGEQLLTTDNPDTGSDKALFETLGLNMSH
jgi:biotin synthase